MKNVLFISLLAGLALSCALQETPVSVPLTLSIGPDDARAVSFPGTRFTNYALVQSLTLSIMKPNGDPITQETKYNPSFPANFSLELPTGKPYLMRIEARDGETTLLATNYRQVFLDGTEQTLRMPLIAGFDGISMNLSNSGALYVNQKGLLLIADYESPTSIIEFSTTDPNLTGSSYSINNGQWIPVVVTFNEYQVTGIPSESPVNLRLRMPDGLGGSYVYNVTLNWP